MANDNALKQKNFDLKRDLFDIMAVVECPRGACRILTHSSIFPLLFLSTSSRLLVNICVRAFANVSYIFNQTIT